MTILLDDNVEISNCTGSFGGVSSISAFSYKMNVVSLWLSSSAYTGTSFSGLLMVDSNTGMTVDVYLLFMSWTTLLDIASFDLS